MTITKEMFERFPDIDGIKQCPQGDYSQIKVFTGWCSFAERCYFAKGSSFAGWYSFAKRCSFAERCYFAKGSSFAECCSFAEGCYFAEWCSFAEGCSFAKGCKATSPYWSFQYKPPFETEGKIYPTPNSRSYWKERLKEFGIQFKRECYDEIEKIITPKIPELLKCNKWTECERIIIESWRTE